MNIEFYLVDSFTGAAAKGNPAGVVITPEELDPALMQKIATSLCLSETAFVIPLSDLKGEYRLRWFTTVLEVPLCGHATLAAAAVLFQERMINKKVTFHTLSGALRVFREGQLFTLDFPSDDLVEYTPPENLVMAMGIERYLSAVFGMKTEYLLIHLQSEQKVFEISPNYPLLKAINPTKVKGITVTATADDPMYDFVSRFFDPWAGIMEDPVTGSAHTLLGPYWSSILKKKKMEARQISPRGGILHLQIKEQQRIFIGGNAWIIGKKQLSIV